ncbi:uncharacterized protein Z520_10693 [Fonsecaea multimorphosa CBS 102226]|uniref:Xylanolytic transcriptional activator regulatory domain-containing protein n=1 Tax=Fonsecaea multimorphosa CBS 102226 TaxID=1442371 RepID=A0A0D2GVB6_9EURO|nr:uncharacterized protein Z520_10693 [Fonsecaea multimorphosa CBS 102226]KIX93515.1 hypothetical protein Z520_10693 [Fonsecaea multimorphosa CBS 102226]OAL18830.1 hypothetical protein AYO22_10159 [Fonsecaea multimorphosa]
MLTQEQTVSGHCWTLDVALIISPRHSPGSSLTIALYSVFRIPPAPRRRKRKSREDDVLARLKHYEELLRDQGIDPTTPSTTPSKVDTTSPPLDDADNSTTSISKPTEPLWAPGSLHGRLIIDQGRSRFIQNKLWTTVSEELHHSKDVIPDTESEDELGTLADDSTDFVLGVTPYPTQTSSLHPSPDHVLKLWQIFLTNVNPLMKIVHQPTLQRSIEEAIQDTGHIPRGLEALMFAIYGAAVLSMRDGECQATFGESRTTLQSRYRLGIRRALTKARFLATSDMVVLQALVIYLLTTRQILDARTLWTLSGVASRIAQGMGVHRDGTVLGLPPFETEMRRRLWWQINLLDFRAAELSGFGGMTEVNWWNTKTPSNVNDVDIWPGMKEQPVDQTRPTEMVVCLLHYAVGAFWRRKLLQAGTPEEELGRAMQRWVATKTLHEKDAFVDEFQANLEEKVLRYCDPSIPLEMMALIIGRTMCKSIRFMAHHPRRYANEKDIPDSERQFLWTTSMALMEADNLAHSHRSLQRFSWHIDAGFQWHSFIFALGELIARPTGDGKDDAWVQIEDVFRNHPAFISDQKKPLHIAIGNLCLKAWRAREKAQGENPQGLQWLDTPQFILQLRKEREAQEGKADVSRAAAFHLISTLQAEDTNLEVEAQQLNNATAQTMPSVQQFEQPVNTLDPTFSPHDFSVMDNMAMDWQRWDTLLNDFELLTQPATMNPGHLQHLAMYGQQGHSWPLSQMYDNS